jgi:phenylpyruvate tautomerase
MPLLKLQTSAAVPEEKREDLIQGLSKLTAEIIGKPESYVMVALSDGMMSMGGEVGPTAFAEVYSIGGLSREVNRRISKQVCALLNDTLEIPESRVYIRFGDSAATDWGWNGSTFG